MSYVKITLSQKRLQTKTVADRLSEMIQKEFPEAALSIVRHEPAESRADRLAEAMSRLEDTRNDVEELRDEISEWRENIPENMQGGEKYGQLEETESALDEIISNIENVGDGSEVEFPSMM